MKKQKLELTWIGKDERPKLEPRILIEDPERSYIATARKGDADIFDNLVVHGDNLLALRALESSFCNSVKCIYIDPPFNTGEMFKHYDDGIEHSIWLTQMRDRLEILHKLLSDDGSLFVHIDDNELGYLIVLLDEIFGRTNRISIVTFKQSSVSGPKSRNPGLVSTANFILYYVKNKAVWKPGRIFTPTERDDRYNKVILNKDAPFNEWALAPLKEVFAASLALTAKDLKSKLGNELEQKLTEFVLSNAARVVRTARVAPKDVNEAARKELIASQKMPNQVFCSERDELEPYYFMNGEQLLFYSTKVREVDGNLSTAEPASTIWSDLLSNNLHKEGGVEFPKGKKPELLLKRLIELSTNPGDLVLDSFGGSGTTGAVAHKMGRRWILVELGEHCVTHILPRLIRVVDGLDSDGATKAVNWQGGGGFRYYRLAPSLLEQDSWGNWVISKDYNSAMLAEAVCKLNGFTYAPSDTHFWEHGYSTERDFIYVTTQTLTREQLAKISEEVGDNRSLLVCCGAFRVKPDMFPNLTLRKIPKAVLSRCEWGKDDYSLKVNELPVEEPKAQVASVETKVEKQIRTKEERRAATVSNQSQMGLFEKLTR